MKKRNLVLASLEYVPAWCLLGIVRSLPPSWKEPICRIAARIGFVIFPLRRRRAIDHILFTGLTDDPEAASKLALQSFEHMAMTGFETLKFDQFIAQWPLEESVTVNWGECWEGIRTSERGYIILSAHCGNWELSTSVAVNRFEKPIHVLARPFANPWIERLLRRVRCRSGVIVHSKIGGTKHLLRALRDGSGVGILVDQRAHHHEGGVKVQFLNRETRAHAVPAKLHLKTGAPIFVAILRRLPGPFRFEFILRGPIEVPCTGDAERDVVTLVTRYASEIDSFVRENPAQWLWSHRLWDGVSRKRTHRNHRYRRTESVGESS